MASPVTPAIDPELYPERSPQGLFSQGMTSPPIPAGASHLSALVGDSALNPRGYAEIFRDPGIGAGGKAAYVGGRLLHDVITDGTRRPYWYLNHPLAGLSAASEVAAVPAGLAPDLVAEARKLEAAGQTASHEAIDEAFAKRLGLSHGGEVRGLPLALARGMLPLVASTTLVQASGNHDLFNLGQGGRTAGYEAIMPVDGNPTQTSNVLGEAAARYLFGRTGRLLPWEQFTQERPDISPQDYEAYKAHQFDKGLFNLGLFKATGRNLEGEPEYTMMGFRVPLSAAGTALGVLAGGAAGANLVNEAINSQVNRRLETLQGQGLSPDQLNERAWAGIPDAIGRGREGHRRMLGAAAGAALGAIAGRIGTQALNAVAIQPLAYSERQAAQDAWVAQQQAAGLI